MRRLIFPLIGLMLLSCTKEPIIAQTVTKPVTHVDTTKNKVVYSSEGETPIKADTAIITPIYISYFSYKVKNPLYVVYTLFHGGGDCSRDTMDFTTYNFIGSQTATDYLHSGYDRGHMVPSEDFAYDCSKEIITFRYYNSLPQYPKSNRGSWKSLETKIRKISQTDSVLIICGGFDFNKVGNLFVPASTFKVYKNLRTKEIKSFLFSNDSTNYVEEEIDVKIFLNNIPFGHYIIERLWM